MITVKDTGVGIPAEMLPRVFDMFAQVDRTLDRAQGGLGIGLALVKQPGGDARRQRRGAQRRPGTGCTFTVRLPLVAAGRRGRAARGAAASPIRTSAPTRRVLVVDDNVDHADSLSQFLRMLGYRTRTANDGPEAVRVARGLPAARGAARHRPARHERHRGGAHHPRPAWGRDVLLLALSGWGQDEDRRRSAEAGFDHHFVKPIDIDALTELLTPFNHPAGARAVAERPVAHPGGRAINRHPDRRRAARWRRCRRRSALSTKSGRARCAEPSQAAAASWR